MEDRTLSSGGEPGALPLTWDPWVASTEFEGIELLTGRLLIRTLDWIHPNGFSCSRTYSSFRASRRGAFGRGWVSNADEALWTDEAGTLWHRRADGRVRPFGRAPETGGAIGLPSGETIAMRRSEGWLLWERAVVKWFTPFGEGGNHALLSAYRSPDGHVLRLSRSAGGALLALQPEGSRARLAFEYEGALISRMVVRADSGERTIASFHYEGEYLVRVERADGGRSEYRYADGYLVSVSTERGRARTYRYTRHQEPPRCVEVRGARGRLAEIHVSERQTVAIDAAGSAVRFGFDRWHRPEHAADALGKTARVHYDEASTGPSRVVDRTGVPTDLLYDAAGQLSLISLADGSAIAVDHDSMLLPQRVTRGRARYRWAFGSQGELLGFTNAGGSAWEAEWDASTRLRRVTYDGASFSLEREGDLVRVVSELGIRTARLDELARVVEVRREDGSVLSFEYDAAGRLAQYDVCHPDSSRPAEPSRSIRVQRDADGAITRVTRGEETIEFDRDHDGRLVRVGRRDGTVIIERDETGRVVGLDDGCLTRWRFRRDARGAVVVREMWGAKVRVSHDAEERIVSETDPHGHGLTAERDMWGRLVALVRGPERLLTLEYGPGERIVRASAGSQVEFEHDLRARVTHELARGEEVRIAREGHATLVTTARGLRVVKQARRLDAVHVFAEHNGFRWEMVRHLDADGRTHRYALPGRIEVRLRRDDCGRVIERVVARGERETERTVFAHRTGDVTRQGDPVSDGTLVHGPGGRVEQSGETRFEYDDLGRRVAMIDGEGRRTAYTWNALHQLVAIEMPDRRVEYTYDPLGRLIERRLHEGGSTRVRWLVWDRGHVVHEFEGNDSVSWVVAEGRAHGSFQRGAAFTLLWDARGRVTEMLDAWGHPVWRDGDHLEEPYQPWVREGHWLDVASGVAFSLFRPYDPLTRSYLCPNPLGAAAGLDAYRAPQGGFDGSRTTRILSATGLGEGDDPWVGHEVAPTLQRERVELVLRALWNADPTPACKLRNQLDPWAHVLGAWFAYLPSQQLVRHGPWQWAEPSAWLPRFMRSQPLDVTHAEVLLSEPRKA